MSSSSAILLAKKGGYCDVIYDCVDHLLRDQSHYKVQLYKMPLNAPNAETYILFPIGGYCDVIYEPLAMSAFII
jgi:hypothetical protein